MQTAQYLPGCTCAIATSSQIENDRLDGNLLVFRKSPCETKLKLCIKCWRQLLLVFGRWPFRRDFLGKALARKIHEAQTPKKLSKALFINAPFDESSDVAWPCGKSGKFRPRFHACVFGEQNSPPHYGAKHAGNLAFTPNNFVFCLYIPIHPTLIARNDFDWF